MQPRFKCSKPRLDMTEPPLIPHGEALRKALIWLGHQPERDAATIEEAARRFDLSPIEEEFLRTEFVHQPTDDSGQ